MAVILCVEDEAELREFLVEELESVGHVAMEAAHGQEALEGLAKRTPDLILCDVNMPVMDGYEFLATVRESHPELSHTPFVFLTALSDREHMIDGKSRSADDYLTKPLDYDMLHATVSARLNQIERIKAKRNEELIKLYRHLANDQAAGAVNAGTTVPDFAVPARPPENLSGSPVANLEDIAFAQKIRSGRNPETEEISVGRLQMIGLQAIKQELGGNWEQLAERVRLVARKTIESHLDEADSVTLTKNDEFIVCFAALGQEDAWHKAKAIEGAIQSLILGDKQVNDLAQSGPVPVSSSRVCEMETETRTVQVSDDDLDNPQDLSVQMLNKIRSSTRKLQENLSSMLSELHASCKVLMRPVRTRTGTDAPLEIEDFDDITHRKLANVRNLANGAPYAATETDILALGKAAEYILDNAHTTLKPIAVEVSYSTLIDQDSLRKFCNLCAELGDFAKKYLIVAVKDFPLQIDPEKLEKALIALSPYSKYQAVQHDGRSIANREIRKVRFAVVMFQYDELLKMGAKNEKAVKTLLQNLRNGKVRVLVDKVPRSEFVSVVNRFSVDLLAMEAKAGEDPVTHNASYR